MRVFELLKLADIDEQTRLVCENQPSYEPSYNPVKVKASQRKFIQMLLELTPIISSDIIVFEKYGDDDLDDNTVECISPELYKREDLEKYLDFIRDKECPVKEYNENDIVEVLKNLVYRFENIPVTYAFEFTEWEKILGWEVYEGNIEELGLQECIYSLLYEMSFNGMTRDLQEERREELKSCADEADEIMNMPEDEREKHFVSFDEIKEMFKKEWGWEEPTLEEREENEKRMLRNRLRSCIWKFNNFKEMLKI